LESLHAPNSTITVNISVVYKRVTWLQFRILKVKVKVKVKVKLSLCFFLTKHHAVEVYWGREGIAPMHF
jgi:hypothetical protein